MKFLAILAALVMGLSTGGAAEAKPPRRAAKPMTAAKANASIVVLHGTNEGGGIDKRIGSLPQLKQPPFSAYDTYKLLKRGKLDLKVGKAASMALPNLSTLQLLLMAKHEKHVVVKASAGGTKMTLKKAKPSDINFMVQKYKKGILVVGIRVR